MDKIFKDFSFDGLVFQNEYYFILFFIIFALVFFEFFPGRRYSFSINKLKRFIDEDLISHLLQGSDNKQKTFLKIGYSAVICSLLVFALANPRWNFKEIKAYQANANIIFAVDLSKSMNVEDEKPSRLHRVKQEINDILGQLGPINIGLFAFANQAHVISPLTEDKESIKFFLKNLSTEYVSIQGSNVETAINMANMMFQDRKGQVNYLVLMS